MTTTHGDLVPDLEYRVVPAGSPEHECLMCGAAVYLLPLPGCEWSAKISCDVEFDAALRPPTKTEDGLGVSHGEDCPGPKRRRRARHA